MNQTIRFTLNGKPTTLTIDTDRKLLWVLRTELNLTGTKFGCGESYCGSCTVLVDNEAVRSCQTTMREVEGKSVVTIEGLSINNALHPLQESFVRNDAMQCGFCTPGMIMTAYAFLLKNAAPTTDQIVEGMDDNLCRCAAHRRIISAITEAAGSVKGGI